MMKTAIQRLAGRRFLHSTRHVLEKKVVAVPSMGDSITEGTIVEWTVEVGQAVKADDVVALVETDKVTVDIKAQMDGVITQRFGEVDDTVEVGKDLYEIDTEGEATVSASDAAPSGEKKTEQPKTEEKAPSPSGETEDSKEGWAKVKSGKKDAPVGPQKPTKPNGVVVLDGSMITSDYGRPKFTDDEMEALMLGGASIAPRLLKRSKGALFK